MCWHLHTEAFLKVSFVKTVPATDFNKVLLWKKCETKKCLNILIGDAKKIPCDVISREIVILIILTKDAKEFIVLLV